MKRELNILIAAAGLWTTGIVAAPLLTGTWCTALLYRGFAVVCHQFEARSFHLDGEPFGVCIRCTAIYAGFLAALILLRTSKRLRERSWHTITLLTVTAVPMALDGMAVLTGVWDGSTLSRTVTGGMFGIGMALLLHHELGGLIHSFINRRSTHYGTEIR